MIVGFPGAAGLQLKGGGNSMKAYFHRALVLAAGACLVLALFPLPSSFAVAPRAKQTARGPYADFNGDGYADLAVGVPGEDVNGVKYAGGVNVLYGSSRGLTTTGNQLWTQDSPGVKDAAEEFDRFGSALAIGDFNGDGYADLAVGVPGEDVGRVAYAGAVNVLYGSPSGLTAEGDQFWHQDSPGVKDTAEVGDGFGGALATRGFNGEERKSAGWGGCVDLGGGSIIKRRR